MKIPVLMLFSLILTGCGDESPKKNQVSQKATDQKKEHLLSDQEKIIQKTKDTEKLIKEAEEKRRKQIEDDVN